MGKKISALVVVLLFGILGGWIVTFFFGFKIPKLGPFRGFTMKPIIERIKIPGLLGMIIAGLISRNYFGDVVTCYPNMWGVYLRRICLSILMVTAGLRI